MSQSKAGVSSSAKLWLMPEGVERLDVQQSAQLERARRVLIDTYRQAGYDYISTPMIEFAEPLLTGASADLELQTQRLTDQISGRLLGIRADITPQLARYDVLDQHSKGVKRYCYSGSVYHARPSLTTEPSRSPFQVGTELFGHSGLESDIEVIKLLLSSLTQLQMNEITLDVGHVGISQKLFKHMGSQAEEQLRQIFNRKCQADLQAFCQEQSASDALSAQLQSLMQLCGDESILSKAEQVFDAPEIQQIIDELKTLAGQIKTAFPKVKLFFDLGEMRGYHYHTGVVFASYFAGESRPIAKGGRYDGLAKLFGRDRAATGFTIDLSHCIAINAIPAVSVGKIYAPADTSASLQAKIAELRAQGESVVKGFTGITPDFQELGCNRQLQCQDGEWHILSLTQVNRRTQRVDT